MSIHLLNGSQLMLGIYMKVNKKQSVTEHPDGWIRKVLQRAKKLKKKHKWRDHLCFLINNILYLGYDETHLYQVIPEPVHRFINDGAESILISDFNFVFKDRKDIIIDIGYKFFSTT